ncbi:MAG: RrF2 family transcriptional regulator [Clostridia bacterium]|nr:RrF2 family transcriptional regulator [Clostridia bacterium]
MISTKGRYALRVMIDLAEHDSGEFTPLKETAERQEISLKYLEGIMSALSKAGLLASLHGKGGGYRLNRAPEDYSVYEILRATEKSLAPVACLTNANNSCTQASDCRTLKMWMELNELTENFLKKYTLADLIQDPDVGNYVI